MYASASHVTHARQHASICCCPTSGCELSNCACLVSATIVLCFDVIKHQPHPTHKDTYGYTQPKGTRPIKIVLANSTLSRDSVKCLPASIMVTQRSIRCIRTCLPHSHTPKQTILVACCYVLLRKPQNASPPHVASTYMHVTASCQKGQLTRTTPAICNTQISR
jgi:hypothetical protein